MRIFRTFLGSVLVWVAVSVGTAFAATPTVCITPHSTDLGPCTQPTTISLTLHNPTAHPIVITQIDTTCGCTKPRYSKSPVMPGDSTHITLRYNPRADAPGTFYKTIKVYTTGGADPTPTHHKTIIRGINKTK